MSALYAYISTKTTSDPYIPPVSADLRIFARDVSDAFVALSGGYQVAGQIRFFPSQRSVPFHLLCDGSEVPRVSFPELYAYLGDSEGTPADADNFVLPDFVGAAAFAPAATADPEDVNEGTVSTPPPGSPPPDWYDNYGPKDSGGRRREIPTL